MGQASAYQQHLYDNDLDGYLQLAKIEAGKLKGQYMTRQTVAELLDKARGLVDVYATPNSFYLPKRASQNIRHFRSLFIDLDLDAYGKAETVYQVILMAEAETIPEPTMIIDSGRGVHLYWRIEHAPVGAAWTWQELEDYLYKQLRHLGADPKATDAARLLRLPGTINSRNGAMCHIIKETDHTYSMYELREQFLNIKPKKPKTKKQKGEVKYLFNHYSLHQARLSDLITLCRIRDYNMTGQRNMTLHCYAYWLGVITRDYSELEAATLELNSQFTEPLPEPAVKTITRCVPKAIEAFLNDEETPFGKAGYNYRTATLIDRLNITEQEQRKLKTMIGKREKYRRKNTARNKARRNENGFTEQEQRTVDLLSSINALKAKGLKQFEIAEELAISPSYVSRLLRSTNKTAADKTTHL